MNMNNNQYLLVVGGDFPLRERILAGALRASNAMPIFTVAKTRVSATLKFFDGHILGDISDATGVLAAVRQYEQEQNARPAAVIPLNDFTVRTAQVVSQYYGLPHNSAETVNRCRNKLLMKRVLRSAGLPVPEFGVFSTLGELKQLADKIGFPVVIKPNELAGSVGVIKVDTAECLEQAFLQCVAEVDALGGAFMTPEDVFLVEEYISAEYEVSVEVINQGEVHRAVAVTDKYLGPEPYFVEIGQSVPSVHADNRALITIAEQACAALGIRYGISHFEARITHAGEVRIIEVGARTGGDAIMDLVERVYGINPYQLHVASYLGASLNLPDHLSPRGLSAVAFLKADVGVIEQVVLPKELHESIVNMQVTGKPKDVSRPPLSWRAREGSIEFFWQGRQPSSGFDEHLRVADRLSRSIFTVTPA
jgi:biotin carboxylase